MSDEPLLKRNIDNQLIGVLQSHQSMVSQISEMKQEMKVDMVKLENMLAQVLQRIDNVIMPNIDKHEKILYGDPENLGKDGLIARTEKNTAGVIAAQKDIKSETGKIMLVGTVLMTAVATFVSWLLSAIGLFKRNP